MPPPPPLAGDVSSSPPGIVTGCRALAHSPAQDRRRPLARPLRPRALQGRRTLPGPTQPPRRTPRTPHPRQTPARGRCRCLARESAHLARRPRPTGGGRRRLLAGWTPHTVRRSSRNAPHTPYSQRSSEADDCHALKGEDAFPARACRRRLIRPRRTVFRDPAGPLSAFRLVRNTTVKSGRGPTDPRTREPSPRPLAEADHA